jgi:hypothetical protein
MTDNVCQSCRGAIIDSRNGDPWPLRERIGMGWNTRWLERQDDWEYGPPMEPLPPLLGMVGTADAGPSTSPRATRGRPRRAEDIEAMRSIWEEAQQLRGKRCSYEIIAARLDVSRSTLWRYRKMFDG